MKYKSKYKIQSLLIFVFVIILFWWINTFSLTTTKVNVESSKVDNDIKIVQITDLHGQSFGANNKKLIKLVEKQKPDIVVATGDMYSNGDLNGRKVAVNLLASLAEIYPVYFVNGEHDNSKEFFDLLTSVGVNVLHYEKELVTVKNTSFYLYGITNVYYTSTFNLANEFTIDNSYYNVILAHIDNFEKFSDFGMDLSICGDTHGGQIRVPFYGPLYFEGEFFPKGECYDKGLFSDGANQLFVSSGLGNYPYDVRLFNRPEIAVITIKNNNK